MAESASKRSVEPNVLAVSEGNRQRVIADGEIWIWVANVRQNARVVGIEVRDATGRRVDNESARHHVDAGRTVQPIRLFRSSHPVPF